MKNNFVFEPDIAAKQIHISRELNAPIERVWDTWTDRDLLDKWIAPKPNKAITKVMDLSVGGTWLYVLIGPDRRQQWVYAEFTAIENGRLLSTTGRFCDANGKPVFDGVKSYRDTKFTCIDDDTTKVDIVISFEDEASIKIFLQKGFEAGISASLSQLDRLLVSETVQYQII